MGIEHRLMPGIQVGIDAFTDRLVPSPQVGIDWLPFRFSGRIILDDAHMRKAVGESPFAVMGQMQDSPSHRHEDTPSHRHEDTQ
jgi:hypothetical protein